VRQNSAVTTGSFLVVGKRQQGPSFYWLHLRRTFGSTAQTSGAPLSHPGAHVLAVYPISTAGLLVALSVMLYGLAHWVRPVYAAGPERRRELKFRRSVSAVLLGLEYMLAIQTSWIMLTRGHAGITVALVPASLVLILIGVFFLARLGQGGDRIPGPDEPPVPASNRVPVGDRTLDRYWKLGIFYFNRDDSTVIVEKRFGLGYSLNFARPTAWIVLLLLVVPLLIPIVAHLL
jgi:uncharacterized membrane protein